LLNYVAYILEEHQKALPPEGEKEFQKFEFGIVAEVTTKE
jgi:hypothetical protein